VCTQGVHAWPALQEALQVYAPLGHALGLGAISASMEDICFKVRGRLTPARRLRSICVARAQSGVGHKTALSTGQC